MNRLLSLILALVASQAFGYDTTLKNRSTGGSVSVTGLKALKQYIAGTAYTNGTPNITCPQAGFAVVRGVLIPYQTSDGAWRMRFNVASTITTASINGVAITFSGVTWKNITNYYQPLTLMYAGIPAIGRAYPNPGLGSVQTDMATGASTANVSGIDLSGDVELDSKPTWAD